MSNAINDFSLTPEEMAASVCQEGADSRRGRRERIATAAMQAMELPNGLKYSGLDWKMGHPQTDAALVAKLALIHADALIAELDKEK